MIAVVVVATDQVAIASVSTFEVQTTAIVNGSLAGAADDERQTTLGLGSSLSPRTVDYPTTKNPK